MKDFVIRRIGKSEIYYLVEVNSGFFLNIPRWWLRYIPDPKGKSSTTLKIDQEINTADTPTHPSSWYLMVTVLRCSWVVYQMFCHMLIYTYHMYLLVCNSQFLWPWALSCLYSVKKLLWDDCPEHWHHSGDSENQRFPSCISQTCHSGATVDVGMIREYYYTRIN